ncbi:MAG: hypothetical protein J6K03_08970 [Oscillospiraceae bacterium]|nr:hypothetical protein [Oscillospiraceae bacterium]
MKKQLLVMFALLLAILLCACSAANTLHFIQYHGVDYEIDTQAQTISDGTFLYEYTFSGNKTSYSITVNYPNGSSYTLSQSGFTGSSSHSSNYSPALFASGDILCDILADILLNEQETGLQITGEKVFLLFILAGVGIFYFVSPHTAWYLSRGWYYKDAEPSDAALIWTRISGAICILLAIIVIFLPI